MNCRDAHRVLNGYIDGELDLAGALDMEDHLRACKRCRIEEAGLRSIRAAVRSHVDAGGAPERLQERLCARYACRETASITGLRRRMLFALPASAAVAAAASFWLSTAHKDGTAALRPQRVVYHISQHGTAGAALRTLSNHLDAAPGVQVVVVAHNNGIDFLLRGARDEKGELYENTVKALAARGVRFRICGNTLVRQHIASGRIVPEATLVPSGIAEIGRLQAEEGYAYMRL